MQPDNLEEVYRKRLFLQTIKNGKTPKRSGLGTRLYHLAGFKDFVHCNIESIINNKYVKIAHPNLNRVLHYSTYQPFGSTLNKIQINLASDEMHRTFQKYLKHFVIVARWGTQVLVYFDSEKVSSWAVLDEDLKSVHPKNYKVSKNGFVYYKK